VDYLKSAQINSHTLFLSSVLPEILILLMSVFVD